MQKQKQRKSGEQPEAQGEGFQGSSEAAEVLRKAEAARAERAKKAQAQAHIRALRERSSCCGSCC